MVQVIFLRKKFRETFQYRDHFLSACPVEQLELLLQLCNFFFLSLNLLNRRFERGPLTGQVPKDPMLLENSDGSPHNAEHADGSPGLREKLMGVEVPPVDKNNASREARIQVEVRNALAFKLYGNATGMPPTHRLVLRFTTSRSSLMVDANTALPTSENYGIDAQYNLIELATNKSVMTGTTFSRVSYDIPGSIQRYARARAFRDAEDRAAHEIAENIQTRLASFFVAGT